MDDSLDVSFATDNPTSWVTARSSYLLVANQAQEWFVLLRGGGLEIVSKTTSPVQDWPAIVDAYNTASIGLISFSDPNRSSVTALIAQALKSGDLPGAIIILGNDGDVIDKISEIAKSAPQVSKMRSSSASSIRYEWPPILLVVEPCDTQIDRYRKVRKSLVEWGVDIELEVGMIPDRHSVMTASDTISIMVRQFLSQCLVGHFPKMF